MNKLRAAETMPGLAAFGLDDKRALDLITRAVAKRRGLAFGHLDSANGQHCAMGAFYADNPKAGVSSALLDEVAMVNDSVPKNASQRTRRTVVMNWLRLKRRLLGAK